MTFKSIAQLEKEIEEIEKRFCNGKYDSGDIEKQNLLKCQLRKRK